MNLANLLNYLVDFRGLVLSWAQESLVKPFSSTTEMLQGSKDRLRSPKYIYTTY